MNILPRCWAAYPSNRVEKVRWKGDWIWSRRIKCRAESKRSSRMPYELVTGVGHKLHPETRVEGRKIYVEGSSEPGQKVRDHESCRRQ